MIIHKANAYRNRIYMLISIPQKTKCFKLYGLSQREKQSDDI